MNWNGKDAALFQQQKEYIDTAIVPLSRADFGAGMVQSAEQHEFIQLLTLFIERQFKGRVLLAPPVCYVEDSPVLLKQWAEGLTKSGLKHVFFFTSDGVWRGRDEEAGGTVIWVPSVPVGDMDDSVKYSIIENQGKQLVNMIIEKWQQHAQ